MPSTTKSKSINADDVMVACVHKVFTSRQAP